MDRKATATALAKAQAYVECGKLEDASAWLAELVGLFADEGVIVGLVAGSGSVKV